MSFGDVGSCWLCLSGKGFLDTYIFSASYSWNVHTASLNRSSILYTRISLQIF